MTPSIPVSWGELFDKISILEIKTERLSSSSARENVARELESLRAAAQGVTNENGLAPLRAELKKINEKLWRIEDDIREKEAAKDFGDAFVALARSVYHNNDERGRLKAKINALLNSAIVDEKQYSRY